MTKRIFFAVFAVLLLATGSSSAETTDGQALRRVVVEACKANVVFLGEPAHHGSAKAIEFKSKVAEALIDKCGFSAIVFESSFYESLYVNHLVSTGKPVDAQMQLDVVGDLWTAAQEFRPFGNFLFEKTSRGQLRLFGMDDQLSAGADLSAKTLPTDLSSRLDDSRAADAGRVWNDMSIGATPTRSRTRATIKSI